MNSTSNVFERLVDNRNNTYFFYQPTSAVPIINTSIVGVENLASFLQDNILITELKSGIFTRDVTPRDDVLIAFLSLFLLLAIEGIVTTLLLRTSNRTVSIFGFSVKHIVELARDFRFRSIFNARLHRVNLKLLVFAFLFFGATFALEVLVLFLTTPSSLPVYNSRASIRLLHPITPEWRQVRFHSRVSINRVCTALLLNRVEQERTSISSCVTSTREGSKIPLAFEKQAAPPVDVTIYSELHRYGAEYGITFGEKTATYSARAYLALSDGEERLMSESADAGERNDQAIFHVHHLFISYLMSSYKKAADDGTITADRLNQILIAHEKGPGTPAPLLRQQGQPPVNVSTTRYTTSFSNVPAVGDIAALQYAPSVLKASVGIQITAGDTTDLFLADGKSREQKATVWQETARGLNWISLLITLLLTIFVLVAIRVWLKPASTAEIAGVYVKGLVGANPTRAPLQITDEEEEWFSLGPDDDDEYRFGAETDFRWKADRDYEGQGHV
ncbi:unnamed protein product [Chondrus crispus]|uniref:Uncharacterized protein n=1 Tax=Chondrus crispus TaxID=2769 RepID=R7QJ08_CHOCR|nr:unnamed protein product [Chondrus crispus]CDF37753.1 unnamed protein product [Chondrus crispus]|eukprot:XP_005717624.1 unnamed protein product [Chondrus crispus]